MTLIYRQRSRVGSADYKIEGNTLVINIPSVASNRMELHVDLTAVSPDFVRESVRSCRNATWSGSLAVVIVMWGLWLPLGLITAVCAGGALGLSLAAYHSSLPVECAHFKDKSGVSAFRVAKGTTQEDEFEEFVTSLVEVIQSPIKM